MRLLEAAVRKIPVVDAASGNANLRGRSPELARAVASPSRRVSWYVAVEHLAVSLPAVASNDGNLGGSCPGDAVCLLPEPSSHGEAGGEASTEPRPALGVAVVVRELTWAILPNVAPLSVTNPPQLLKPEVDTQALGL